MNASLPAIDMAPPSSRAKLLEPYQFEALLDDPRLVALTDFAAALCEAPASFVSLVTDKSQWFVARTGSADRNSPLDRGFCVHAKDGDDLLVVPDAKSDPYFAKNTLVTGPPFVRFYAGAPLRSLEGDQLGALCVIDQRPRDGLTELQAKGLRALAQAVMTLFETHRALIVQTSQTNTARGERDDREQQFAVLADTMPQMVWSTNPAGAPDYFNARWYEFTGVPKGSTEGDQWATVFHPDDQDRAWQVWQHAVHTGEPYDIEYRLRDHEGNYRWVLGRALPMRDDSGAIVRWFGTCTDIHDQKVALEQRELISHELSHRIKNIFSVISGLIGMSGRESPVIAPIADQLRERIMALGRAHDFVRPHSEASRPSNDQNSLHGLIEELLEPYRLADNSRVLLVGEDVEIDDRSATPLALLFHELATNSAKYGALSSPTGQVAIDISVSGSSTRVEWRELGGPAVTAPAHSGFGSKLIAMSVERQLGGTLDRQWEAGGLKVTISLPCSAMRRRRKA